MHHSIPRITLRIPTRIPAPMNLRHHGQTIRRRMHGHKNIDGQTVLGNALGCGGEGVVVGSVERLGERLVACWAYGAGIVDGAVVEVVASFDWDGLLPAERAGWGGCVAVGGGELVLGMCGCVDGRWDGMG